jgi:DNA-binding GntR family transcriptional regulator
MAGILCGLRRITAVLEAHDGAAVARAMLDHLTQAKQSLRCVIDAGRREPPAKRAMG